MLIVLPAEQADKHLFQIELPCICVIKTVQVRSHTLAVSSRKVVFSLPFPVHLGMYLDLEIEWPCLLNNKVALALHIHGRVGACKDKLVTLTPFNKRSTLKYEFHTRGRIANTG